jgi:uncharacterized membrane protein YbhN (UPF0104 family)
VILSTSGQVYRRRAIRVAITALVVAAAVGIGTTMRHIEWTRFASALAHVAALPLALALCTSTLQVFSQLARFLVILPRAERAPLEETLEAIAVGQLINYTTAFRAGDAYKLARLCANREDAKGRFQTLAAVLVLERAADLAALLFFATLGSRIPPSARSAIPTGMTAMRGALVVLLAGAIVLSIPRARASVLRLSTQALRAIASPGFAWCFVVALGTWVLDAGTLYWSARSAGCPIPFRTAVPCLFLLNVGTAVPVTVGNLGIFEATLAFALCQYGIGAESALAIATIEHVTTLAGLVLCTGILRLSRFFPGRRASRTPAAGP